MWNHLGSDESPQKESVSLVFVQMSGYATNQLRTLHVL
jgi:hypothetical protein